MPEAGPVREPRKEPHSGLHQSPGEEAEHSDPARAAGGGGRLREHGDQGPVMVEDLVHGSRDFPPVLVPRLHRGIVHDFVSGIENPPEDVQVSPAREGVPQVQGLVEAAQVENHPPPDREAASAADADRPGDQRDRHPVEAPLPVRRKVDPLLSSREAPIGLEQPLPFRFQRQGFHLPGTDGDAFALAEDVPDRRRHSGSRHDVVIDERDDLHRGFPQRPVPGEVETRNGFLHVPDSRELVPDQGSGGGAARRIVHHQDFLRLPRLSRQGAKGTPELVRPVAAADRYADTVFHGYTQRGRGRRPVPASSRRRIHWIPPAAIPKA